VLREAGMTAFPVPYSCRSASASDAGKVRQLNEDACLERCDLGLWVVADGVGGHAKGDLASRLIVQSLAELSKPGSAADFMGSVAERLVDVNGILRREAVECGAAVIASTVVALLVFGQHYACVWAGDSRLYRLRGTEFRQLTRDHSQVQTLIDAGLLDPGEADGHPLANVVIRAVGAQDRLVLDRLQDQILPGDLFLLCTDGLTRMVEDETIAGILASTPLDRSAQALVDAALDRGAFDNVTAVVVRCEPGPVAPARPQ
jgi:serine/threonine protein phosphatase PrpC